MGCHRKPSRIARRLPIAAAPALAGVAAAFCLSPQALAEPSAAQGATHHAAAAEAAGPHELSPAQLLSVTKQTGTKQAVQHRRASAQSSSYTVQPGDSLSAIAGRVYHSANAWPVLYWANRSTIRWADIIEPGQVLQVPVEPARIPAAPTALGPAPAPAPAVTTSAQSSEASAPPATPDAETVPSAPQLSSSTYDGGVPAGSFGQCVISRESGGDAQVMNSTGHYGLYQFSASTWAEYGGNPADFGDASAAEQNQVFATALAGGGESNWSAYDGC